MGQAVGVSCEPELCRPVHIGPCFAAGNARSRADGPFSLDAVDDNYADNSEETIVLQGCVGSCATQPPCQVTRLCGNVDASPSPMSPSAELDAIGSKNCVAPVSARAKESQNGSLRQIGSSQNRLQTSLSVEVAGEISDLDHEEIRFQEHLDSLPDLPTGYTSPTPSVQQSILDSLAAFSWAGAVTKTASQLSSRICLVSMPVRARSRPVGHSNEQPVPVTAFVRSKSVPIAVGLEEMSARLPPEMHPASTRRRTSPSVPVFTEADTKFVTKTLEADAAAGLGVAQQKQVEVSSPCFRSPRGKRKNRKSWGPTGRHRDTRKDSSAFFAMRAGVDHEKSDSTVLEIGAGLEKLAPVELYGHSLYHISAAFAADDEAPESDGPPTVSNARIHSPLYPVLASPRRGNLMACTSAAAAVEQSWPTIQADWAQVASLQPQQLLQFSQEVNKAVLSTPSLAEQVGRQESRIQHPAERSQQDPQFSKVRSSSDGVVAKNAASPRGIRAQSAKDLMRWGSGPLQRSPLLAK